MIITCMTRGRKADVRHKHRPQTVICVAGWCVLWADRQKAGIQWSASGCSHAENETLKNCLKALSLFPRDVHSGSSFVYFRMTDKQLAFKTRVWYTEQNRKEVLLKQTRANATYVSPPEWCCLHWHTGDNVAFSPSVKPNKEDEHPVVSKGECCQ